MNPLRKAAVAVAIACLLAALLISKHLQPDEAAAPLSILLILLLSAAISVFHASVP